MTQEDWAKSLEEEAKRTCQGEGTTHSASCACVELKNLRRVLALRAALIRIRDEAEIRSKIHCVNLAWNALLSDDEAYA